MTTKVDYHEYLASREWRLKRNEVIDLENGHCSRCKSAPIQSVHHLTYETLGDEDPYDDLLGVCDACHEYLAAERADDPALQVIQGIIKENGLWPDYHKDGYFLWLTSAEPESEYLLTVSLKRTEDLDRWDKAHVCLPFGPGITAVCTWV